MMLKPLMNELNKQMTELNREMQKEQGENVGKTNGKPITSFKIHFGVPGQMPISINSSNAGMKGVNVKKSVEKKQILLPKIDVELLKKANKLLKKEPEAVVRRLSDSIIYEIKLPGVNSINAVGIAKVSTGFEIKACSKNELFVKHINLDLKLLDFELVDENLVLEFEISR